MSLQTECMVSTTLELLIYHLRLSNLSILDFTLYIDDDDTPIVLKSESDYEPYLSYYPLYAIDDASYDGVVYHNVIRLRSPKTKQPQ